MTRFPLFAAVRRSFWPVLLGFLPAAAGAGDPPAGAASASSASAIDRRTLEREIIPQFVKTHAAPSPLIEQLTRWHDPVCPDVAGTAPEYAAAVTAQIFAAAQAAGAPAKGAGHRCTPNIRIIFTTAAQQLVDSIDKDHAALLGSARVNGDTTVSRAIQAWYLTGTRQLSQANSFPAQGMPAPGVPMSGGMSNAMGGGMGGGMSARGTGMGMAGTGVNTGGPIGSNFAAPPPSTQLVPDPAWDQTSAPGGAAGSRPGPSAAMVRSELLQVLIVVDGQKLNGLPLQAVSGYIAFLALTRVTALDACAELPSIVDLLAARCVDRDKPAALSPADAAFLKALYASSLEGKIGSEEAEVSAKMLTALTKQTR